MLATLLHAGLFVASPTFAIDVDRQGAIAIETFDLPDLPLPPEPEEIVRPAAPVLGPVDLDPDLTIPPDEQYRPELPPPPPPRDGTGGRPDRFTPMTIRPELVNEAEVARALARFYPPLLRDAGIGGTVTVWFHLDQDGRVRQTQLNESSGYDALDRAALEVADRMRFTPAWNRDQRVAVWVSIPITFESR